MDDEEIRSFIKHQANIGRMCFQFARARCSANPADLVEVNRADDSREHYLSEDEFSRLKVALDEKMFRRGTKDINQTNLRMRLIVLIAVSTGMRSAEIHRLQ